MTVKVGYQGTPGSYSEAAAVALMDGRGEAYDLLPLITSARVAEKLRSRDVVYGVAAVENTTAGIVEETKRALPKDAFARIAFHTHFIRHCLFLKDETVWVSQIERVASHEQALRQCGRYLHAHFPDAELLPAPDTGFAAESLASGVYGADTAIICSRGAGISRNLRLLDEEVQDNPDNATTFALFCLEGPR